MLKIWTKVPVNYFPSLIAPEKNYTVRERTIQRNIHLGVHNHWESWQKSHADQFGSVHGFWLGWPSFLRGCWHFESNKGESFSSQIVISFIKHQLKVKIRIKRKTWTLVDFCKSWVNAVCLCWIKRADLEFYMDSSG